jgi:hypothetical protein
MEIIEIKTLVDITNTKVIRSNQGTQLELDQNRNFITLAQCIELRSVVFYDTGSTINSQDIKSLGFGSSYKGKQTVWTFRFSPDRPGAYEDEHGNMIGTLLNDINEIPVIKNLSETINIDKAIFDLQDPAYKNTVIKVLKDAI